jgi:hypothetical protein
MISIGAYRVLFKGGSMAKPPPTDYTLAGRG